MTEPEMWVLSILKIKTFVFFIALTVFVAPKSFSFMDMSAHP